MWVKWRGTIYSKPCHETASVATIHTLPDVSWYRAKESVAFHFFFFFYRQKVMPFSIAMKWYRIIKNCGNLRYGDHPCDTDRQNTSSDFTMTVVVQSKQGVVR